METIVESQNASNSSQSNYQGIIIIVIVIIGILLFIFLLVEFVTAPAPIIAPFTNGTVIRIKSLANNKYLRPFSCSDLGCTGPPEICNAVGSGNYSPVIANGASGEPGTNWVLCQYQGTAAQSKGELEAAYLLYNTSPCTTSAIGVTERYVVVDNNTPAICPTLSFNNLSGTCDCSPAGCIPLVERYINFVLVDSVTSESSFNQNGVYTINVIDASPYGGNDNNCGREPKFWYVNNEQSLPINCGSNSNLVEIQDGRSPDRTSIDQKLNYSFFVEVVTQNRTTC